MNAKHTQLLAAVAAAGLMLGGCGGGGGNGSGGIPPISSTNPASAGKLTFAVGTANIEGTTTALNVVTTFRSSDGLSASLVNTPTISGPFKFTVAAAAAGSGADPFSTIPGGPGPMDIAASSITGTPQTVHVGTTPTSSNESSFGQSGGVFSQSISPGNETNNTGQAYSYVPYNIDVYGLSALNGDPGDVPFGGPPAFDPDGNGMGLRDGLNLLGHGVLGIPEGFTAFDGLTPSTGTYSMSLSVSTGFSGSTPTFSTVTGSATLSSTTPLPLLDATLLAFTPDGNGGATFTVPASYFAGGVSEVYVQVIDTGNGSTNCQGALGATGGAGDVYYTIVATAGGSYTLPDTDGPNIGAAGALTASESICTAAANTAANGGTATAADSYEVLVIGADYDMYGYSYITSKKPPAQTASFSGKQADITVSAPLTAVYPA
ncbi:MAG TPA: hypothetical protein VF741_05335, partial [Candidatus Aquilonibacter sp.]